MHYERPRNDRLAAGQATHKSGDILYYRTWRGCAYTKTKVFNNFDCAQDYAGTYILQGVRV